jgi:hypothetical protein
MPTHKSCKRTIKNRLNKLNYIVQTLRDMYNDNCPAIPQRMIIANALSETDIAINNLRHVINTEGQK